MAGQDPVGTPAINAGKAAPPLGSQDERAPDSNAVGAHLRHASDDATSANRLAAAIKCQRVSHSTRSLRLVVSITETGSAIDELLPQERVPRAVDSS